MTYIVGDIIRHKGDGEITVILHVNENMFHYVFGISEYDQDHWSTGYNYVGRTDWEVIQWPDRN